MAAAEATNEKVVTYDIEKEMLLYQMFEIIETEENENVARFMKLVHRFLLLSLEDNETGIKDIMQRWAQTRHTTLTFVDNRYTKVGIRSKSVSVGGTEIYACEDIGHTRTTEVALISAMNNMERKYPLDYNSDEKTLEHELYYLDD